MPSKLYIFLEKDSAALQYTFDFIFNVVLGCGFECVYDLLHIPKNSPWLAYSCEAIPSALQIVPCEYLSQEDLLNYRTPEIVYWRKLPVFFSTIGQIPFDMFAAVFFLLSRAEEYTAAEHDDHGRFLSVHSLFDREFIQRPIIDEWIYQLKFDLLRLYPELSFSERRFTWINTYDIDIAYAYRHRGYKRLIGATFKNLFHGNLQALKSRYSTLVLGQHDPYDTYHFQKEISRKVADHTYYFFLLGNRSKHDNNLSYKSQGMRELIKEVAKFASVGIHPSYYTMEDKELLLQECCRLKEILAEAVTLSRQHFLRFQLPSTFQMLEKAGIQCDFSMGYVDEPGFRSGTCTPHFFFDIEHNRVSNLKLIPLHVMDGSLRDYQRLSPAVALENIKELIKKVYSVDGTFVSLWHNDVLSKETSLPWRQVYEGMATYIADLK